MPLAGISSPPNASAGFAFSSTGEPAAGAPSMTRPLVAGNALYGGYGPVAGGDSTISPPAATNSSPSGCAFCDDAQAFFASYGLLLLAAVAVVFIIYFATHR